MRDVLRLRGQVIAVALVVACGIATYVTMRSSYASLVEAQRSYYEAYRFADVFAHVKRAPNSLATDIANIPGIGTSETRIVVEVTLDVPGLEEPATARLISIPGAEQPKLNGIHLRRGRWVNPQTRNEVLVSESFAEANNLDAGQSIGAVINGRWQQLSIAGIALSPEYVHEIRGADVFPDRRRFGVLWMSREALGPAFNMEGAFNDVAIALAPGATEAAVIAELDLLLDRYGSLGAYGRDEQESNRFLSDEISQDRITGIFLPAIFLGVAAFLIHMVLGRLVGTERPQKAVMKAIAYSYIAVAINKLKFALYSVMSGTAVGIGLGIWWGGALVRVYEGFFRFPKLAFVPEPDTIALAVAISAGAALLGAVSAVRGVVKLPPAEAMRPEPPARFRPGLIERIGLRGVLSPSAKMIVRNISRRGWKSALSVSAIALAVAILVVGRYSFDALDYIIDVHFRTVQREDVAVTFNEPRASGLRFELTRLPGVLQSEPFRAVPVRMRFGHRSKRLAILGLDHEAELRLLLDADLKRMALPADGLVLTTKLAELLGVKPGDEITVEVLEGERPVLQVPVAAEVDELIGLAAYMDASALNRLMREGGTISGAYLSVDPKMAPALYKTLKQTPAVAGVAIREMMLASFLETVAESLTISTTVLIAFACVIAFGVVYNGTRIALSERGHELASLRVLGFTRREISVILLGEQAVLTLTAMPLGFLFGFGICVLLVKALDTELYRMPLTVSGATYAFSFAVVSAAAVISGLLVLGRLYTLDLVAVLKTRE